MKTRLFLAAAVAAAVLPVTWPAPAQAAPDVVVPLAVVSAREGGVSFDGRVYFAGYTPATGKELWVTDGTAAGTAQVLDLAQGTDSSQPESLAVLGGRLYFSAWTAQTGSELWSTDGTAAGTQLAADIVPGADHSYPTELVAVAGRLYFVAQDLAHGRELWSSDGTQAGTRLVADIFPGESSAFPGNLTRLGDRVVYSAHTTMTSSKPFVSGAGIPGARQLDPLAFDVDLRPAHFAVAGDLVVFRASGVNTGLELWVSRGQPGDAHLLKDIAPGLVSGNPTNLQALGDRVLFSAGASASERELWASDGTEQGTVLVRDINPNAASSPQDLTLLGGQVVFSADDGVHGRELWATGGSAESTHLVADAYPGVASGVPTGLGASTPVAGQLLYNGADARGLEPWVTDGLTSRSLADLAPGLANSVPAQVGVIGNVALFNAREGSTDRLYAWTAVGSTTAVTARKKYSAKQARKKRITLPVAVSSDRGEPLSGGTVTLTRLGKVVGTAPLVNGSAKVRITVRLRPGRTHLLVAAWSGVESVVTGSASAAVPVRVRKRR